jgi:hypothetical protein
MVNGLRTAVGFGCDNAVTGGLYSIIWYHKAKIRLPRADYNF